MATKQVTFTPQTDITAFELSGCIMLMKDVNIQYTMTEDDFDALDTGISRNLTGVDVPDPLEPPPTPP